MIPLRGGLVTLARRASVALALQVGGAACSFVFSLVLTKRLGAAEAGVYFLALTVASVAATAGRVGMDEALVRFAAAERSRAGSLYRAAGLAVAAGTLVMALALVMGAPLLARAFGEPGLVEPLRWMGGALIGVNAAVFHAQLLKGIGQVRAGVFAEAFLRPAVLLVGFLLVGHAFGASGATAAYLGAGGVAALSGVALWRLYRPSGRDIFPRAVLFRTALPLFGSTLLLLALQMAPTLLLGLWGTTADVAIYSVAFRLVILAAFMVTAVNTVIGPQLALAHAQGDRAATMRLARRATLLTLAAAAPLLLLYALAPAWTMGWFGAEFRSGALVLVVLTVGQVFNVAAGSAGQVLLMSGWERDVWWGMVVGSAGAGALGVWLIPLYGVEGAAVAGSAALILFNAYNIIAVRRRAGFWTLLWAGPGGTPHP